MHPGPFLLPLCGFSILEAVVALLAVVALAATAAAGVGRDSTTLQQHTVRLEVESLLGELARDSVAVFSVQLLQRHVCIGPAADEAFGCAPWQSATFGQVVVDEPSQHPGQLLILISDAGFLLAVAAQGPNSSLPAACAAG